jgi:hypothetical protein
VTTDRKLSCARVYNTEGGRTYFPGFRPLLGSSARNLLETRRDNVLRLICNFEILFLGTRHSWRFLLEVKRPSHKARFIRLNTPQQHPSWPDTLKQSHGARQNPVARSEQEARRVLFLLHRVGPPRYWYLEEGNVHHELLHLTISSTYHRGPTSSPPHRRRLCLAAVRPCRLMLPGELAKHAVSGNRAVTKFNRRKRCVSVYANNRFV